MRTPCHRAPLAQGALCTVDYCNCGIVHLTVGAVTLRLDRDAAQHLCKTVADALRILSMRGATRSELLPSGGAPPKCEPS